MTEDPAASWRPSATLATLQARAKLLAELREYFAQTGVMEVETPVCAACPTPDPGLESLVSRYVGPGWPAGRLLYLQTSPEFAMKRLLAAGSGAIFQLGKAFRNGELGRLHNPEFTLLEWYRPGYDHHQLMNDVAALLKFVGIRNRPVEKHRFGDLFRRALGFDPLAADVASLRDCALEHGLGEQMAACDATDRDTWLDLLLTELIEPGLGRGTLCFVYDYPASKAALARLSPADPRVAERFELYMEGVEIANGFHELTDAQEQRRRFEAELGVRRATGMPSVPIDERLLAALTAGLPPVSGVALGVDRLLLVLLGRRDLADVMAFSFERA